MRLIQVKYTFCLVFTMHLASNNVSTSAASEHLKRFTSMQDFFPEVFKHGILSEISWDHAVNSKDLLTAALSNDKHMIEADVLIGRLIGSDPEEETVIMGHPPSKTSDLSLRQFLDAVVSHNSDSNAKRKKGVKLDFKESQAYSKAITPGFLLSPNGTAFREEYTKLPIWINGDIVKGPVNSTNDGVDLQLTWVQSKPEINDAVIWSLGWTTTDYQEGSANVYTTQQVNAMIKVVQGMSTLTFPVRAMYAAKSREAMVALLKAGTLTVWSGKQDDAHVDVPQLAKLIADYLDKVYVDVPDTLWQRIQEAMR